MATQMQNYAKFDSRIEEGFPMQQSISSYDNGNYYTSGVIDSTFDFFGDFFDFAGIFFAGIFFFFGFFLFLYIFVSLFSKGGEKTSEELKKILIGAYELLIKGLKFIGGKIKNFLVFLLKRKFLFGIIIILLIGINFTLNVVDGKSKLLRLTKIGDSYVGVDLKNNRIIKPGYFLYSPIKTTFFLSPTNNFDFEIAEVTANTSEELGVILDYRVGFKIIDEKRLDFYKKYGTKSIELVSSDIVMPRLLEIIKGIIKSYSYKDISSKHNDIKNITMEEANEILASVGIELQEINILDIRLPETYLKSKQDLLNAETKLKLATAELETQKKESEKKLLEAENAKKIKIIESEAIAEGNKIISSQEISDMMIELKKLENESKKIEKWDGKLPTTVGENYDF